MFHLFVLWTKYIIYSKAHCFVLHCKTMYFVEARERFKCDIKSWNWARRPEFTWPFTDLIPTPTSTPWDGTMSLIFTDEATGRRRAGSQSHPQESTPTEVFLGAQLDLSLHNRLTHPSILKSKETHSRDFQRQRYMRRCLYLRGQDRNTGRASSDIPKWCLRA